MNRCPDVTTGQVVGTPTDINSLISTSIVIKISNVFKGIVFEDSIKNTVKFNVRRVMEESKEILKFE